MRETFRSFNFLRLAAALAILCFHYLRETQAFSSLPIFFQQLVSAGPIALPFFFILSGFVLSHAYIMRVPHDSATRRSFWMARVARLYPVYLLAFILFLPIAYEKYLHHAPPHGVRTFVTGGLLSLFALQSWTPFAQAWNGPSWSLSVEAFFYLLFPVIFGRCLRTPLATLAAAVGGLWLAMLGVQTLHQAGMIAPGVWAAWIRNNPVFWSPMFLAGILAYRLLPHWRRLGSRTSYLCGYGAIAVLIAFCGLSNNTMAEALINGAGAPLLILIVLAFSHSVSIAGSGRGTETLYLLGGASYVTYILQAPVWHLFVRAMNKVRLLSNPEHPQVWHFLLYVAALLGLSLIVQELVERPTQRWIRARSQRREALESEPADIFIEAV